MVGFEAAFTHAIGPLLRWDAIENGITPDERQQIAPISCKSIYIAGLSTDGHRMQFTAVLQIVGPCAVEIGFGQHR